MITNSNTSCNFLKNIEKMHLSFVEPLSDFYGTSGLPRTVFKEYWFMTLHWVFKRSLLVRISSKIPSPNYMVFIKINDIQNNRSI